MASQDDTNVKLVGVEDPLEENQHEPTHAAKKKETVQQAPRQVKILILTAYFAFLIINVYAVWQWDLATIRLALTAWMSLYMFEAGMVLFPGWLSSPWVVHELLLHHLISAAFVGLVLAMPPCVNQPIVAHAMGVWMLINWNESVYILTDVLGLNQHDSCLSITRRVGLSLICFILSPVACVLVNWHMIIGIKMGSLNYLALALSMCILLFMNAFSWAYYPYIGYRSIKSLQRTYASRRIGTEACVGSGDAPNLEDH